MQAAQAQGAELRPGCVTGLVLQGAARVTGVEVDGTIIEGDAVVIAMGPWSMLAARWLPLPAVFGLKGHSLVFETGTKLPAEALFLEFEEADGGVLSPEVFPRTDGTTYVCAISSDSPVPLDPGDVAADPGAIDRLQAMCGRLSPVLAGARVVASQACYRPVTQDGLPLIGPVPGVKGAYVATGHSVWGILNAPATGEAMAELIIDGSRAHRRPVALRSRALGPARSNRRLGCGPRWRPSGFKRRAPPCRRHSASGIARRSHGRRSAGRRRRAAWSPDPRPGPWGRSLYRSLW